LIEGRRRAPEFELLNAIAEARALLFDALEPPPRLQAD
jgi:hypothetical protein